MPDDPNHDSDYWFPTKRYGWGWGPPRRWQGWVVILLFGAATAIWMTLALTNPGLKPYSPVGIFILIAVLIAICLWKGEPPRWRWGD